MASDQDRPDDVVRVRVDDQICIGIGQCEMLEPEIFHLDDDDGYAVAIEGATLTRARAEAAIEKCPSRAITIEGP